MGVQTSSMHERLVGESSDNVDYFSYEWTKIKRRTGPQLKGLDVARIEVLTAATTAFIKEVGAQYSASAATTDQNLGGIHAKYEFDQGSLDASFSSNSLNALCRDTGQRYVLKGVDKSNKKQLRRLENEIEVLKSLEHPNIAKNVDIFEDTSNFYSVWDCGRSIDLFDRIASMQYLMEPEVAHLMRQMLRATAYMHAHSIAHRDLKPENWVLANDSPIGESVLKLKDFTLAKTFAKGGVFETMVGSPYYVSPQVLQGCYNQYCDSWSLGVVMYILLIGYPPFNGQTDVDVIRKIRSGSWTFPVADWEVVSCEARQLICNFLKYDPMERYTPQEGFASEWAQCGLPNKKKTLDVEFEKRLLTSLKQFCNGNHLRRIALATIASQLNQEDLKEIQELFFSFDKNGTGLLPLTEVKEAILKSRFADVVPQDFHSAFQNIEDQSGYIDYREFLAATVDRQQYLENDKCWTVFRMLDENCDGKISTDELHKALVKHGLDEAAGSAAVQRLMKDVDTNGDYLIDFQEFLKVLRGDF